MFGGEGADPHPPSRSSIPPVYPRCRARRELDPVITSADSWLRLFELVERFDFGRRECSVVDADFVKLSFQ